MIVDKQSITIHVGDVDERVLTFIGVADVNRGCHEQGIIFELIFGEFVLAQDLIRPQRERQQLRTTNLPFFEFTGVDDPQPVARVHLRLYLSL